MKIEYFEDTDTVLVEIGDGHLAETREVSGNISVDVDTPGNVVSITIEHASDLGDPNEFYFQRVVKGDLPTKGAVS